MSFKFTKQFHHLHYVEILVFVVQLFETGRTHKWRLNYLFDPITVHATKGEVLMSPQKHLCMMPLKTIFKIQFVT